jgi:biotin operon repressor
MEPTRFQAQQLKWLKQQVQNLRDERNSRDPRPRLEQELFAAREELDNYVEELRKHGYTV